MKNFAHNILYFFMRCFYYIYLWKVKVLDQISKCIKIYQNKYINENFYSNFF